MSGKTTGLTALEMRKQLLVIESELNRAHLLAECREVKRGASHLADQLSVVTTLAETVSKIGASFTGFFQGMSGGEKQGDKKPSWITTIIECARTGMSLWTAFSSGKR